MRTIQILQSLDWQGNITSIVFLCIIFIAFSMWSDAQHDGQNIAGGALSIVFGGVLALTEFAHAWHGQDALFVSFFRIYFSQFGQYGLIMFLLSYLGFGLFLWTPVRWMMYLKDKRAYILKDSSIVTQYEAKGMHPKNNIHRLMLWAVLWPYDAAWQLTKRPVKYTYHLLYTAASWMYVKIFYSIFPEAKN